VAESQFIRDRRKRANSLALEKLVSAYPEDFKKYLEVEMIAMGFKLVQKPEWVFVDFISKEKK